MGKNIKQMSKNNLNGRSYEAALADFKFTKKNPNDVRNGETRAEWFVRLYGVTGEEFVKIGREREIDN